MFSNQDVIIINIVLNELLTESRNAINDEFTEYFFHLQNIQDQKFLILNLFKKSDMDHTDRSIKSYHYETNKFMLQKSQKSKTNKIQEIQKESEIMKKIKNKYIIKCYGTFQDEENHYIIMEYAEKGDLNQVMKIIQLINDMKDQKQEFSEDEIWNHAWQLIQSLNFLHEQKLIHRDMKSQNVFISKDNTFKLGDFGLSKKFQDLQLLNTKRVGTPLFIPPEIIQNKNYDEKIDIWGLGCILYHMAELQLPFQGENIQDVSFQIINKKIQLQNNKYSENLNRFILQMLERNVQKRSSIKKLKDNFPKDQFQKVYLLNYQKQECSSQFSFRKNQKYNSQNNFFEKSSIKQQNLTTEKKNDINQISKNDIIKNIYLTKEKRENLVKLEKQKKDFELLQKAKQIQIININQYNINQESFQNQNSQVRNEEKTIIDQSTFKSTFQETLLSPSVSLVNLTKQDQVNDQNQNQKQKQNIIVRVKKISNFTEFNPNCKDIDSFNIQDIEDKTNFDNQITEMNNFMEQNRKMNQKKQMESKQQDQNDDLEKVFQQFDQQFEENFAQSSRQPKKSTTYQQFYPKKNSNFQNPKTYRPNSFFQQTQNPLYKHQTSVKKLNTINSIQKPLIQDGMKNGSNSHRIKFTISDLKDMD